MAEDKQTAKLNLPRLRVSSHTFNDTSYNSLPNVSQRTVSSSTSLLSTPSNNIRRVQKQINAHAKPAVAKVSKSKPPDVYFAGVSSTAAASKKLLNLHQSKKAQTTPRPFVLRKPVLMTKYDYSVFVDNRDQSTEEGALPPPVKSSQIRAWESAEKISAEIIFDDDSLSQSDALDTFDEASDNSLDEQPCSEYDDPNGAEVGRNLLESIPQHTKGELKVILKNFRKLQTCTSPPNCFDIEDAEKKELWLYRQHQNVTQERAFTANHTILGKRKVQVFHKKEFLHKLFGYSNNINQACLTNNTSYSATDNAFNAQKAFHEDKEEILGLLAEDKAFEEELKATKEQFLSSISKSSISPESRAFDQPMENSDLLDLTNSWLTSSYEKQTGQFESEEGSDNEPDEHPEVIAYTIGHLKQRVKDAYSVQGESVSL